MTIEDQVMRDFTAGHISTDEARQLLAAAQEQLGSDDAAIRARRELSQPADLSRRASARRRSSADTRATPPHDLTDKSVLDDYPRGPGSDLLNQLMSDSVAAVRRSSGERRAGERQANCRPRTSGCGAKAARRRCGRSPKSMAAARRDDHGRRSAARAGGPDRLAADRSARRDRLHRHRLRRQGPLRDRGAGRRPT